MKENRNEYNEYTRSYQTKHKAGLAVLISNNSRQKQIPVLKGHYMLQLVISI